MSTPPLSALRTFEAVARLRSMSRAAVELGVTQGAVSRAILLLEAELDTSLFRRTKPLMHLTDAGRALYQDVRPGLLRVASGLRRVRQLKHPGRLAVDSLPTFAIRFLIPRLPRLRACHPDIDFDLTVSERAIDFEAGEADIAIRYGLADQWPDLGCVRFMEEELLLVAAPHTPRTLGTPFEPAMLPPEALLRHTTRAEVWREWFMLTGTPPIEPRGLGFEHFIMVIEAAVAGMGFALVPRFMIQRELETGTLVVASNRPLRRAQGYHVLFAAENRFDQRIASFTRWLAGEVQDMDQDAAPVPPA